MGGPTGKNIAYWWSMDILLLLERLNIILKWLLWKLGTIDGFNFNIVAYGLLKW